MYHVNVVWPLYGLTRLGLRPSPNQVRSRCGYCLVQYAINWLSNNNHRRISTNWGSSRPSNIFVARARHRFLGTPKIHYLSVQLGYTCAIKESSKARTGGETVPVFRCTLHFSKTLKYISGSRDKSRVFSGSFESYGCSSRACVLPDHLSQISWLLCPSRCRGIRRTSARRHGVGQLHSEVLILSLAVARKSGWYLQCYLPSLGRAVSLAITTRNLLPLDEQGSSPHAMRPLWRSTCDLLSHGRRALFKVVLPLATTSARN